MSMLQFNRAYIKVAKPSSNLVLTKEIVNIIFKMRMVLKRMWNNIKLQKHDHLIYFYSQIISKY